LPLTAPHGPYHFLRRGEEGGWAMSLSWCGVGTPLPPAAACLPTLSLCCLLCCGGAQAGVEGGAACACNAYRFPPPSSALHRLCLLAVCCGTCFAACACFVACCCGGAQTGGEGGQRAHALRTTALPSSALHRLCLLAVCCGACFAACACFVAMALNTRNTRPNTAKYSPAAGRLKYTKYTPNTGHVICHVTRGRGVCGCAASSSSAAASDDGDGARVLAPS
jgi:hypothetical protein